MAVYEDRGLLRPRLVWPPFPFLPLPSCLSTNTAKGSSSSRHLSSTFSPAASSLTFAGPSAGSRAPKNRCGHRQDQRETRWELCHRRPVTLTSTLSRATRAPCPRGIRRGPATAASRRTRQPGRIAAVPCYFSSHSS